MTESSPRQSDLPSAGVNQLLARARERMLRPLLLFVALLASFNVAISIGQFWHGSRGAALCALGLLGVLWATALVPLRTESTRIGLTLTVMYAASTFCLLTVGLGAGGVMAVFGFVALTALLRGLRASLYAFGLAVLTMGATALGFRFGALHVSDPHILDPHNLMNWLRVGTFSAVVLAAVGGVSVSLLRTLTGTLEERGQLVRKLRDEIAERERAALALKETQQRLIHAHKLEVLGRLAGGIAHDFNNTLTVILSYAELLRTRLSKDETGSDLADQILRAAEQGGDLTRQLLTFSRRQVVKPRTVDVQQALRNTERAITRLSPRAIRVHCAETSEELCVRIDPTQLEQTLLNLAINARDAMPEGGDLTLETKPIDLSPADGVPLLPGPYVVVEVRDTGTGMTPAVLARVFEPFFTTKEPGLGTGLGLANVRETTDGVGGHVSVDSELGKGTTFRLYFPRARGRVSGIETRSEGGLKRQASILVVDDDPQIREVIRTILVEGGYDVHIANSARHARELSARRSYDLLWTDLVMPDMSGKRLIDEFSVAHPSTPVLVCSAYVADESVSQRVARGELSFLAKPFTRKALVDVVERALRSPFTGDDGHNTSRSPVAAR